MLVGPSLYKIGRAFGDFTDYRIRNVLRIGEKAARKVDVEEPGSVHPRVAQRILEDGSWIDDPVAQEYLAGLLAGARTAAGDDDSAAYFVNLVASLSSTQIRVHHAIYAAIRERGTYGSLGHVEVRSRNCVFLPDDRLGDLETGPEAAAESLVVLHREGLVETYHVGGDGGSPFTGSRPGDGAGFGLYARPSIVGTSLFGWAYGRAHPSLAVPFELGDEQFDPPGPSLGDAALVGTWR